MTQNLKLSWERPQMEEEFENEDRSIQNTLRHLCPEGISNLKTLALNQFPADRDECNFEGFASLERLEIATAPETQSETFDLHLPKSIKTLALQDFLFGDDGDFIYGLDPTIESLTVIDMLDLEKPPAPGPPPRHAGWRIPEAFRAFFQNAPFLRHLELDFTNISFVHTESLLLVIGMLDLETLTVTPWWKANELTENEFWDMLAMHCGDSLRLLSFVEIKSLSFDGNFVVGSEFEKLELVLITTNLQKEAVRRFAHGCKARLPAASQVLLVEREDIPRGLSGSNFSAVGVDLFPEVSLVKRAFNF
eukprot:CAMPEP_0174914024 /NCGR_PEP_ID=MMETSP0167-20121228/80626_1 /TAXON_ID=38298 /ORGANISM="Rhodella maculata, Strain CCMP736" /LENGTH=305 /DNA_ID=CAMNT_0016158771 /DNA_START=576 /DNA_END=1493 /DNA_ORIENTATION=-